MGAHENPIQRAVVLVLTVMGALVHGAFDALVGMTIHCFLLLLIEFALSMTRWDNHIQEKLPKLAFFEKM